MTFLPVCMTATLVCLTQISVCGITRLFRPWNAQHGIPWCCWSAFLCILKQCLFMCKYFLFSEISKPLSSFWTLFLIYFSGLFFLFFMFHVPTFAHLWVFWRWGDFGKVKACSACVKDTLAESHDRDRKLRMTASVIGRLQTMGQSGLEFNSASCACFICWWARGN